MSIVPCYKDNIKSKFSDDLTNNKTVIEDETPAYLQWYEEEITPLASDEPEPSESDNFNVYEYLYQNEPPEGVEIALSDVSSKDAIWDTQRDKTATVGDIYSYNAEFERYYERMSDCSTWLSFGFNENGMKLKNSNFCRVRHCPVCQWRKSLFWKHNMYVAYDEIKEKYPTHRWIFLTLTVKNCEIGELRETLQHMNKAWQRLIKRKEFMNVVEGWVRTTEITRPKDPADKNKKNKRICPVTGNTHAHPHFHVMLLVKPSYFGKNYLTQQDWSEMWQSVLRVDYLPIVDVRAIKPNKKKKQTEEDAIKAAVAETLKYSVKPDDLIGDGSKDANAWFFELTRQTFKLRFISSGGVLKDAFKPDDKITDNDLIDTGGDEDEIGETDERRLAFTFRKDKSKYLYAPYYNQ